MFNLQLAFPDMRDAERKGIVRGMVRQIGWMAGEFSQFPKYTAANIPHIVTIDGAKNFECAQRRGKGVLFLTGHMSAWELAPFAHALYGHPLHFLVRPVAIPASTRSSIAIAASPGISRSKKIAPPALF